MVVKIETVENGWVYYSVKRKVAVKKLDEEEYKKVMETSRPDRVEVIENLGDIISILFEDNERVGGETVIFTNLSAYLLNDEGKTVERLN